MLIYNNITLTSELSSTYIIYRFAYTFYTLGRFQTSTIIT